MGEVRQALITANVAIGDGVRPPDEVVNLWTLGNIHSEGNVEIIDVHCREVSFGVPLTLIEVIQQLSLLQKVGKFLVVSGTDINGQNRSYCFQITKSFVTELAFDIFTALAAKKGAGFVQANRFAWTEWMK